VYNNGDNYIFINMTILNDVTFKIECYENDCSIRLYVDEGELALGVVRATYSNKGGKVPQLVIQVTNMVLDEMIAHVIKKGYYNVKPLEIVKAIKADCVRRLREHLTQHGG